MKAFVKYKPSDKTKDEVKAFAKGDSFDVMDLLSEDSQFDSIIEENDEDADSQTQNQNIKDNHDINIHLIELPTDNSDNNNSKVISNNQSLSSIITMPTNKNDGFSSIYNV